MAPDLAVLVISTAATWALIELGVRWVRIAARVSSGGGAADE